MWQTPQARVFIGHFGVALAARSKATRVALLWWVSSSYLPDIARWLLSFFTSGRTANLLSHSLLAIAMLSVAVFATKRLTCGAQSADWLLMLICMSHWALDVFTGCKPTLPGRANVGLDMYLHPLWDLPTEMLLLCFGWWLARGKLAVGRLLASWRTPIIGALAQVCLLALIAATSLFYIGSKALKWKPSRGALVFEREYTPPPPCGTPRRHGQTAGSKTSRKQPRPAPASRPLIHHYLTRSESNGPGGD